MVESHLVRDIGLRGRGGGDLLVRKPIILMLRLYGLRNIRIRLRRAGLGRVGRIMMCRIGRIRMELVRWRKIILMMLILKSRQCYEYLASQLTPTRRGQATLPA